MIRKISTTAILAVGGTTLYAGTALAGPPTADPLPAPGIIGLVALGVVGAIALAKSRK